ncbi:hypothetical protein [Morganella morganii]|uniref:hypothetical protein n=1 Tax=Morganella morganii TaxID=582 RepID=UPI001299A71D|nr:hypothetical protein [Morganella morganii]MBT0419760.1 hypothetical protein [Morganella morganii subsp. morganii]MBT0514734.1 hypothetical protein [Morganella morganii subsp. morganii]MRE58243.1 hypothetical protein [Morganella morganii]QWM02857.1 hypothetical protein IZ185_11820 [Morganella morganii subsp. morganii]HBL6967232.1 hypothetical protein [Morganella morganii]
MFDDTPLESEELIDQCRALVYAVVNPDNQMVKEILTLKLCEQIELVHTRYLEDPDRVCEPAEFSDDKVVAQFC